MGGPNDTIVAVSSPAGRSERAIVRLSGPRAVAIAERLFTASEFRSSVLPPSSFRLQPSGLASLPTFRALDGEVPSAALRLGGDASRSAGLPARLYLMRAPRSYTREDVVELHLPGNPVVVELVLEAALAAGARLAEPGEFTRRALENGRIGASQAEAVMDVIGARSRAELLAAAEGLAGHAGRELAAWRERAEELAARMEAELDYGEAAGDFLDEAAAERALAELAAGLDRLIAAASPEAGREAGAAGEGGRLRAVLAGPVNAGKSLLFSRLTGSAALVSDLPGTTRDAREAPLAAAPRDIAVVDTAGLGAPAGEVELLAAAATERAWRSADLLLLVADRSDAGSVERLRPAAEAARAAEVPVVLVFNKCDLRNGQGRGAGGGGRGDELDPETSASSAQRLAPRPPPLAPLAFAEVSALTGAGCPELAATLVRLLRDGHVERGAGRLASSLRRREALARARSSLRSAVGALEEGLGLACAADDLRDAARTVARHFEPGAGQAGLDEGVLNRIFARFCVGK